MGTTLKWDEISDPLSAREVRGNAVRKALGGKPYGIIQTAVVMTRPIPANSEDYAALMAMADADTGGESVKQDLKDIFRFKATLLPEGQRKIAADGACPDATSLPYSEDPFEDALRLVNTITVVSKKGYTGKPPKEGDFVEILCFYSDFEDSLNLQTAIFSGIKKSNLSFGAPMGSPGSHSSLGSLFNGRPPIEGGVSFPTQTPVIPSVSGVTFSENGIFNQSHVSFLTALRSKLDEDIAIHATSGVRDSSAQARAMYNMINSSGVDEFDRVYRHVSSDLRNSFKSAIAQGNSSAAIAVVDQATNQGNRFSSHADSLSLDLRTKDLTSEQIKKYMAALTSLGTTTKQLEPKTTGCWNGTTRVAVSRCANEHIHMKIPNRYSVPDSSIAGTTGTADDVVPG